MTGDGGTLGDRNKLCNGRVDRADALIQRQSHQPAGRKAQSGQGVGRGSRSGRRLAQPPGQILRRLLDARHRHAGQFARALQCLDGRHRGAE